MLGIGIAIFPDCISANDIGNIYNKLLIAKLNEYAREMLVNLEDSKTVLISYHADDPNVGMSFTKDVSRYKLFILGVFKFERFKLYRIW